MHAKIQHYVPQFLLRPFAGASGADQVHVYDKHTNRTFVANIRNVAAEKGFYDIEAEDVLLSFEPALSELEGSAAEIIERIKAREEIGFLTRDDRATLSAFVIVQHFRTRHYRESFQELTRLIQISLNERDPGASARLGLSIPDEDETRIQALRHLESSVRFSPLIESKAWVLYEAPLTNPFWISDHPIALHNSTNHSDVYGTIGLAVPGIEIYLPISPRFCLGFICQTIRETFSRLYEDALRVKVATGIELQGHDGVGSAKDGFEYGFPVPSLPENVEYLNSLEVLWAERFIFSSQPDFRLAVEMVKNNPRIRKGPRPEVH